MSDSKAKTILKVTLLGVAITLAAPADAQAPAGPATPVGTCDVAQAPVRIWVHTSEFVAARDYMLANNLTAITMTLPGLWVLNFPSTINFVQISLTLADAHAAIAQSTPSDAGTYMAKPAEMQALPLPGGYSYSAFSACMYGRQSDGDDVPPGFW